MKRLTLVLFTTLLSLMLISVYAEPAEQEIKVLVDGRTVAFPDAKPFINAEGKLMLPLKCISDEIHGHVQYDAPVRTVIITGALHNFSSITFKLGEKKAAIMCGIDKSERVFDTGAMNINGRIYISESFLSKVFLCKAEWVADKRTINITQYPDWEVIEKLKADPKIAARAEFTNSVMNYYYMKDGEPIFPIVFFRLAEYSPEEVRTSGFACNTSDGDALYVIKELFKYYYPNSYETVFSHYVECLEGAGDYKGTFEGRFFSCHYGDCFIGNRPGKLN